MGFAQTLTNGSGLTLWTATGFDAADRELTANYGNATNAIRVYDPHTGHLYTSGLSTNANGQSRFQETNYYDVLDNMLSRTGQWDVGLADTNEYSDVFTYDPLNRVHTAQSWSQPLETFNYDAIGNITSKTSTANGGTYHYPGNGPTVVGPHAVQSIDGLGGYVYDVDGNMTSAPNAASSQWTSFDMPVKITKGSAWDGFIYGPNRERIRMTRSDGSTTYYSGPMEALADASGNLTLKTYWPQGLGVDIDKSDGTTSLYWTPHDRLGSVMAYVDVTGAVVEQLDYDAWGRRRNANGVGIPDSLAGKTDDKGFTGQQMLDNVNLVHLNGRIYDPLIGRFLSADPLVQAPENSQSYNRYTYVWNNPTNMTDPTGFEGDHPTAAEQKAHHDRVREKMRTGSGLYSAFLGIIQIATSYVSESSEPPAAANTEDSKAKAPANTANNNGTTPTAGTAQSTANQGTSTQDAMGAFGALDWGLDAKGDLHSQLPWSDRILSDAPTLPSKAYDFSAGLGDEFLLGQGGRVRSWLDINSINTDSGWYTGGKVTGGVALIALGAGAGAEAAGTAGEGMEFSHALPARWFRELSISGKSVNPEYKPLLDNLFGWGKDTILNGNFRTAAEHALSDPMRYRFMSRAGKKQMNCRPLFRGFGIEYQIFLRAFRVVRRLPVQGLH